MKHHLEKFSAEREEHAKVATVLWQDDDVQYLSRLSHTSLSGCKMLLLFSKSAQEGPKVFT